MRLLLSATSARALALVLGVLGTTSLVSAGACSSSGNEEGSDGGGVATQPSGAIQKCLAGPGAEEVDDLLEQDRDVVLVGHGGG